MITKNNEFMSKMFKVICEDMARLAEIHSYIRLAEATGTYVHEDTLKERTELIEKYSLQEYFSNSDNNENEENDDEDNSEYNLLLKYVLPTGKTFYELRTTTNPAFIQLSKYDNGNIVTFEFIPTSLLFILFMLVYDIKVKQNEYYNYPKTNNYKNITDFLEYYTKNISSDEFERVFTSLDNYYLKDEREKLFTVDNSKLSSFEYVLDSVIEDTDNSVLIFTYETNGSVANNCMIIINLFTYTYEILTHETFLVKYVNKLLDHEGTIDYPYIIDNIIANRIENLEGYASINDYFKTLQSVTKDLSCKDINQIFIEEYYHSLQDIINEAHTNLS